MDKASWDIVLTKHKWFLAGGRREPELRAVVTGMDLRAMDFYGVNLAYADLRHCDLDGVNLGFANLECADLRGCTLTNTSMHRTNLNLSCSSGADFTGADLVMAEFGSPLPEDLPEFQICPKKETFIGYKKVRSVNGKTAVLALEIVGNRTSSLVSRKCRTEKALVLKAVDNEEHVFYSLRDGKFRYRIGEEVLCWNYDNDWRVSCAPGIHFFMTEKEAREYDF